MMFKFSKKTKRTIYALCAAAGFATAALSPSFSVKSDGVSEFYADFSGRNVHDAAILVGASENEKAVSASAFSDVPSDSWYYPYVDYLVKNGIINGTSEQTYTPNGTFTAAECAAVITRYLGLESYALDAGERLKNVGMAGADLWYSGYLQTMYDLGILDPYAYRMSVYQGYVSIDYTEEVTRPLKRYEFAEFITKSFDVSTEKVKAHSIYPEISDNGNSFIVGGRYDSSYEKYTYEIADFESIPATFREYVLKAYYNGIFNGDENGNFNPGSPILRGEMSKVISVITDDTMRQRNEYRTLTEKASYLKDNLVTDGWREKVLDRAYAYELLSSYAEGIAIENAGGSNTVTFLPSVYPSGYFVEARIYNEVSGVYKEAVKTALSDNLPISASGGNMRVLLLLRSANDAKVEGVLQADIASDGSYEYSSRFKPVLG